MYNITCWIIGLMISFLFVYICYQLWHWINFMLSKVPMLCTSLDIYFMPKITLNPIFKLIPQYCVGCFLLKFHKFFGNAEDCYINFRHCFIFIWNYEVHILVLLLICARMHACERCDSCVFMHGCTNTVTHWLTHIVHTHTHTHAHTWYTLFIVIFHT